MGLSLIAAHVICVRMGTGGVREGRGGVREGQGSVEHTCVYAKRDLLRYLRLGLVAGACSWGVLGARARNDEWGDPVLLWASAVAVFFLYSFPFFFLFFVCVAVDFC